MRDVGDASLTRELGTQPEPRGPGDWQQPGWELAGKEASFLRVISALTVGSMRDPGVSFPAVWAGRVTRGDRLRPALARTDSAGDSVCSRGSP